MQDQEQRAVAEATTPPNNGPDTADEQVPADAMPGIEQLLRQAELAAKEHHDAWLRAKAEADNIRKRAQVEVANAHRYALETFAGHLLPVRDSLEAALTAENTLESLRSGVELTLRQLTGAMERANIKEINPLGEKLDPHKHQAMNVVLADAPPNTVIAVLQKGYELNDRVIRPALVSVARGEDA
jgi:molecular chaperone GrpE